MRRLLVVLAVCWVAAPVPVSAGDTTLLEQALQRYLAPAESAAARADGGRGGPDAVQAQYDSARELEEALRATGQVPQACLPRLAAALAYARAEVFAADGYDRISRAREAAGARRAAAAAARLRATVTCVGGVLPAPAAKMPLLPLSNSVALGSLVVRATTPPRATEAVIRVNGRLMRMIHSPRRRLALSVSSRPGRYTVAVRYLRGRQLVATAMAANVWLLPSSAHDTRPAVTTNARWAQTLRAIGSSFNGYSGLWIHDLATGASAGWNADARFPAASTVKLGVLIAALRRFGPTPETSRYGADIEAVGGWSSNLAANRLLSALGGSEAGGSTIAEETLHRLGATSSTYTGFYRVGTSARAAGDAPRQPPIVSARVTTARDLGRVLYMLHAGAIGDPIALRVLRLTRHEARVGLNVLLSSEPSGDNLGLFRPFLGDHYPMAQKNGWISTARHTAALVYTSHGPVVVVVLSFRSAGITRSEAARAAEQVLALARP